MISPSQFDVVLAQPGATTRFHEFRRLSRLLGDHRRDDHVPGIDAVDDPPRLVTINDAQFVAPGTDLWHTSRMGQRQSSTFLEHPYQLSGLSARANGKRWRGHAIV